VVAVKQESVMKKAVDRLSRPKKNDTMPPIKKPNRGADLLDSEGPSLSTSGYVTNDSSVLNGTPGGNNDQILPPLDLLSGMGMDLPEADYIKEKTSNKLYDDALAGNNLLAMVNEPKAKNTGSALMDFFVDPTQMFASERHPALQDVLKLLSKSKQHRG
jgi:hypothetical protein